MQRSMSGGIRIASTATSCAAVLLAVFGLTACGGGGGGNDNPPPAGPSTEQPPPPANTAPTVNAGEDQTITLPTNSVELQGSATDAQNDTLTYAWTASPAEGVTFANPAAAATQVTFTDPGTYTLTLTVSDGTASGTDTVIITVQPADAPPPPPPPPPTSDVWPGPDSETDPNHGWVAATPVEVGMDSARLIEAATYALTGGGAGMITRHGKLVHQWSDGIADIDQRVDLKSTTKSMGGIALGLALDEGLLTLADRARTHLPTLGADVPTNDPTMLDAITVQQLATHTSGFDKPGNAPMLLYGPPGTKWFYSDGGLNWLADVLTTKFNRDLQGLLNERVWTPLQITSDDLTWRAGTVDANNLQFRELSSGITANANAMARVGLLFLRKGMWNGQRILSEAFVETVSTPRPETAAAELIDPAGFPSANLGYGLLWWTNGASQIPEVPTDTYWAWGLGDSLIIVIPSLDIVVARVGNNPDGPGPHWRSEPDGSADWNGNYEVLRPFLIPIVQSVTNPEL